MHESTLAQHQSSVRGGGAIIVTIITNSTSPITTSERKSKAQRLTSQDCTTDLQDVKNYNPTC